jgi:hypothetical protein
MATVNDCICEIGGLGNLGHPNCVPKFGVISSLIFVPLKANDGTLNRINTATVVTSTTFTALTQHIDPSKRWYPTPTFENVNMETAESLKEESASGRVSKLRTGKVSFTGELWDEDSTPQMQGKLEKYPCQDFGFYIVDDLGNLIGSIDGGYLLPIPAESSSLDVLFNFKKDDTTQKLMVMFDVKRNFRTSTLRMISSSEGLVDFGTLEGLIDANIALSSITATGFVATVTTDYGTALTAGKVKGQVSADFNVYNDTDSALIVPASIVETADGVYTAIMPAQTSADAFTVSLLPSSGFVGEVSGVIP